MDRRAQKNLRSHEIEFENYKNFEEGFQSADGPLKYLSPEEKLKINLLIDQKLEELESTGLSREEILYDDARRGIPLDQDPFFQFVKKNYTAREILLSQGEEYTVEKVVEMALRQDIGPDPNQSLSKTINQQITQATSEVNIDSQADSEDFNPQSYLAENTATPQNYISELLKNDQRYHFKPLTESQKRRRIKKHINYFDIHWRNTELLTQFLNTSSKIKHRRATRLGIVQQRKVSKNIKIARELMLLPYFGSLKPSDRRSLRTLEEEIEEMTTKCINIQNGNIYINNKNQKIDNVDKDYVLDKISDNLEESPVFVEAYGHSLKQKEKELIAKGIDVEQLKKNQQNSKIFSSSSKLLMVNEISPQEDIIEQLLISDNRVNENNFKQSFEQVKSTVLENSQVTSFSEQFILERSNSAHELLVSKEPVQEQSLSVEESLEIFNKFREQQGVKLLNLKDL